MGTLGAGCKRGSCVASTKGNARLEKKAPQFDLVKAVQVATVRDLLLEINDEIAVRQKKIEDLRTAQGAPKGKVVDVPAVTFRSLAKTLSFVKEISGVDIKGELEEVDIMTLSVVKLLFSMSDKRVDEKDGKRKNSRNIFALLQRPKPRETNVETSKKGRKDSATATMESCTGTTIPRDPMGEALIEEFVSALSKSIDPEKLAMMEAVLAAPSLYGPGQAEALSGANRALGRALHERASARNIPKTRSDAEKLLDHIALGTGAVEDLLFRAFSDNDRRLASAYRAITNELSRHGLRRLERTEVPVHEALYVHARTLGLQHFILHHREFVADIHITKSVNNIDKGVSLLCEDVYAEDGAQFGPADLDVPLASLEVFVQPHLRKLMALVELAIGLATPETVYESNVGRAKKILKWAVYRRYDRDPPEPAYVCMLDVVAALCSVRFQQERKTPYSPYWESQKAQGTSPERMLDAFEFGPEAEFGLHQGAFFLYYNRYKAYLAAFTGTSESHKAFTNFELCRLDGYLSAMQSRSLMEFQAATLGFSNLALIFALDFVYANP